MDGASFDVIINRHDLTTSAGESIPRRKEIKHPNYNGNTMTNDFALVFLNRGTTEKVDFVKLNQDNSYPSAGSSSRAMGWGTTSSGGSSSSVLREVRVFQSTYSLNKFVIDKLLTLASNRTTG
jgi:hypothetical protein